MLPKLIDSRLRCGLTSPLDLDELCLSLPDAHPLYLDDALDEVLKVPAIVVCDPVGGCEVAGDEEATVKSKGRVSSLDTTCESKRVQADVSPLQGHASDG